MKVLIVDDNQVVLTYLGELLTQRGHEVRGVQDWIEANKLVHRERPDLILVDENLGNFQGCYLVRAFRSFFGNDLPIVVMSAEDVAARAREAGADGYVPKATLAQVVPDLLELARCPERARCRVEREASKLSCATCGRVARVRARA